MSRISVDAWSMSVNAERMKDRKRNIVVNTLESRFLTTYFISVLVIK